ncbi:MAG: hypothetical protein IJW62_00740 [Clostridia bacterium]|nr:hypothetical protein [Clostridia bacterium]
MKKRLLIPILAVLLLTVLSLLPVFAAGATANVNSVSAGRGETITLTVTLAKGVTVGSGGIEVSYDASVLELMKGEWNVTGTMLSTFTGNKGAFAYTAGTQISGKVFTATFKVKSNAAFGASTVKITLQLKDGSNADISVTNNSGKVTVNCKHSYSKWSSVSGTSHSRTCSVCGNKETANHGFSNACDTKCDDCGYTRTITHSYKTTWSNNSSKHWHECSVCKVKKDEAVHTPGPAATENTPQTCTTCGYVIQKALGHTHKPTGDWLSDDTSHWHDCSTCDDRADEAAHIYDNVCDTDCNVCGHTRTVTHTYTDGWTSDKSGHWHACAVCGAKDEVIAHTPGAEATEETPQLCTVCAYEIAPAKAHEHEYTGDYITDADGHRKTCKCGEYSEKAVHTYDGGKVVKEPTSTVAGQKTYTCTECGYVKTVELELVEKEVTVTVPDKTEDDPDGDSTPADGSGFSVISLLIGALIGAVVGAAVMLVVGKKKR